MVRLGDVERAGISYSYHSDMPMAPGQPLFLVDCSIVPGKLANFTILSDNPLTVPAARIKDITVWGTVHEGRKLPIPHQASARVALGSVASDAASRARGH